MTDITTETIDKLLEISAPRILTVEDARGVEAPFSDKPLHEIKAAPGPEPADVHVFTLAGFADLIREKLEDQDFPTAWVIHVEDERTVALKPKLADRYGRRQRLVHAQPVPFQQFKFGQWMDQDAFAIAVASLFADTEDKAHVLKLASTLTNEASNTSADDGFTQQVTVRRGLAMKDRAEIKPRVALAPFRTFPEVAQPVSEFVFRAQTAANGTPQLMLVEADGGHWKVDAIRTIQEALGKFSLGVPIVA